MTEKELRYLIDQDFLITKRLITDKITKLLSDTRTEIKEIIKQFEINFPEGIDNKNGKISKGENYQNLPYLVLDFPKLFKPDSVFAFRTMVWWGNEISFTLHLQGKLLVEFREILIRNHYLIQAKGIYLCVNPSTPWEYHFGDDNYLLANELETAQLTEILSYHSFIKISKKFPLSEIENISSFANSTFLEFMEVLDLK
ncbi:hypothetical protein [Flexithrix dorotheae]|uniref:hypothetical protein n=1 Tax=Flexithrix dorotheae TaxID=70993 RepID=UPI000378BF1D|nr:hypothetical protein [Flexithrix dorotheae]